MFLRTVITASAVLLTLTACDRIENAHEIVRAGNQTFLLNKTTGEAKLIDGTSLLTVKVPASTAGDESFKRAKIWPEVSINELPGVKFKLRTKYRDGAMLWNIDASPFSGLLEKSYGITQPGSSLQPTVIFEMHDDEGFKTSEAIEVKIRLGAQIVNSKNEVVELNWSGTQPMAPETYRSASLVSTKWYGFRKEL